MDYLVKIRSVQTPLNGQFSIGANINSKEFKMKKQTEKNKTTYDTEINKKALQEVIDDLLKSYPTNKKIQIVVL